MLFAVSQVCCLNSPLETDVADFAAGHCEAIEIWLTKLEAYLENHSLDDVKRLLEENEIKAPVASYQGGLLITQGEARQEAWSLLDRRLKLCRDLGIETLVVAGDVVGPLTQQDLDRATASLLQLAQAAEQAGVRAALEFQAKAVVGNNLLTAAAMVADTGNPWLGLCLDAFHYYVGPSQESDLACLTTDNLFHVQVCDLADTPREFAADSQRILPGDGDIPLGPIVERLAAIGYDRTVSIELMNPQLWQVPALQMGEIGMTALRKVFGQASM
ncbi:sugar phosphate isomerase/epimerase family protein [Lignipirellula cremea]|uniref:Inosose isomerase n=1 Tax=Lignipirellula cremea TaxID=2528010 RepID=A0A518DX35_9BACT|nr:sugar phosphate isomerase/epimerase family protein [Lignipirellula cremea]QDU96408.1 Inosose isomerase [Lignipirellula cremea]